MYQLKNYFNIRIYIIPIWFYFNCFGIKSVNERYLLYIPIWFYFNSIAGNAEGSIVTFTFQYGSTLMEHKRNKKDKRNNFTFQYGSTLIYSCQFRIFFMLICSFLSTSLYLFYFPIHFIMFFIKKPLIPFIYIPLSTSSHFYFIEHRQNFSLLIYIIYKFNFIISHFIISTLHNFNFFAWTQIN